MDRRIAGSLVPWILAAALATGARAQEWTRFRGPNGTGIARSTGIPVEFNDTTCAWKVDLPGTGHSSPVVWEDRVFVTSAEEATGRQHLLCFRATDGQRLWIRTRTFTPYRRHRYNSFASSTPAVDRNHVYVVWPNPEQVTVVAYDHQGQEVWTRELGPWGGQHGGACSPIVVEDVLVVRNDCDEDGPPSFVAGLDCATGAVRWKLPRLGKTASYSTPVLYQPPNGPAELILTSNAHGFTSIDPRTGRINWELPGVFAQRCVSGPVILPGGLLFGTAGNGAGERQAVAVRPKMGSEPATVVYRMPARGVPYVPTPLVVGDWLFLWGDGGIVACARAATGEILWMERVGGNFFASPVCVDGKLFNVSTQGELVVIEAGPQFRVVARSQLGEGTEATPAVSGGRMFIRTESHLVALGGKAAR